MDSISGTWLSMTVLRVTGGGLHKILRPGGAPLPCPVDVLNKSFVFQLKRDTLVLLYFLYFNHRCHCPQV